MTYRPTNRLKMAIALGFAIVVAQLLAFGAIGFIAWNDLVSPDSTCLKMPLIPSAQMFRDEVIYPVCEMKYAPKMVMSGKVICLRAVDLQTGRIRDIEIQSDSPPQGLVADGERLWCCTPREIYEFDGTTVVKHQPKQSLRMGVMGAFIYEGRLAQIHRDAEGNDRLQVLVDDDWQDRGQVAFPGVDRKWVVDEGTGDSVLVPRTSADSMGKGSGWVQLHVIKVRDQYHLLHVDAKSLTPLSYRVGFDFVTIPSIGEPVSALAPINAPAETTGWVLLDSNLVSSFGSQTASRDDLLIANDKEIWRQVRSNGTAPSHKFERVVDIDMPDIGFGCMVSSPETHEVYVVAAPMLNDIEMFRLEGNQLRKMPYQIEGMGKPLQRWMWSVLWQGLAVLGVGTLLLVLLAAWMSGEANYSFAHDSVRLAPIIRRCLARGLDLSFVFGPLVVQTFWMFRHASANSIMELVELDVVKLAPLLPGIAWACLAWIALVASTGIGGVTPGKWVCGIRVVRTTLRRCGILQSLLRELLLGVDVPQLLTAIPGVICLVATENRQRIGDLAAGTLVIDVNHLRLQSP